MTTRPGPDYFDRARAECIERIDRHGFTAAVVGTGECHVPGCSCVAEAQPFAYGIGMVEHGLDEFVTFGLSMQHVACALHPICKRTIDGDALTLGREHRHVLPAGPVVSLVRVPDRWVERDPGRIGSWFDVYDGPPPAFVQIVWADNNGRMPWESGCHPDVVAIQPVLADDPNRFPKPMRDTGRHRRRGNPPHRSTPNL